MLASESSDCALREVWMGKPPQFASELLALFIYTCIYMYIYACTCTKSSFRKKKSEMFRQLTSSLENKVGVSELFSDALFP